MYFKMESDSQENYPKSDFFIPIDQLILKSNF